jgi:hypothetical protein
MPAAVAAGGAAADDIADTLDETDWADLLADPVGGDIAPAASVPAGEPAPVSARRPVRRLGHTEAAAQQATVLAAAVPEPDTAPAAVAENWQTVPDSAPSLLLSATDLLDARDPGPVLSPGARYRVASVQNGVVGLHVAALDGTIGLGFCAAVDLICIDPRFAGHKPGRPFAFTAPQIKSRVQRFTGGLSEVATSLLG